MTKNNKKTERIVIFYLRTLDCKRYFCYSLTVEEVERAVYAIKIFHGYLTAQGKRTRDKSIALTYTCKEDAERFANKIGGRVKKIG